jgi:hypothetical protein
VRTANPDLKQRLLNNEDDCVAMRVVMDAVQRFEVRKWGSTKPYGDTRAYELEVAICDFKCWARRRRSVATKCSQARGGRDSSRW